MKSSLKSVAVVTAAIASTLLAPAVGRAQDPQTGLASAQAEAAAAQADIAPAEESVRAAQAQLAPIAAQAEQASRRAEAAFERLRDLKKEMVERRIDAAEEVAAVHANYEDAVADHDQEVNDAIGIAIGCLLLGLIAVGWEAFRSSSVARWLADQSKQRAAFALGLGFLILAAIAGGLVGSSGGARAAGYVVLTLAVGLVIALLVARHSLLRERGETQAILVRGRLPRKASLAAALVLALIFAGSLGSAVSEEDPDEPEISAHLAQLADAAEGNPADPATAAVRRAAAAAKPLIARADGLDQARREAEARVDDAEDALFAVRRRLSQAERSIRTYTRLIAEQAAAAQLAAERQAAQEARQARQAAAAAEAAAPVAPVAPTTSGDLDCADVGQTDFPVPPGDPNGFDADGDGIGCET